MAASSGDDIPAQLSALLGHSVKRIRITDETPPRISVIDAAIALTGKSHHDVAQDFRRVSEQYPEVGTKCSHFRFKGRGQRDTPITTIHGLVELVFLLPGRQAAQVRRQAAELLVRYLGGDLSLVDEVCRLRGFQEELAVRAPMDPRRFFGESVEAAAAPSAEYVSRLCTDVVGRTVPVMIEKLTSYIDERLAQLGTRQIVNLNVRAPKRAAPHLPRIANDIAGAGRPLPLAKFLDEKEREDTSWKSVRRSFTPAFGMLTQVLKKKKLKDEGRQGMYVEQNHRAQILYAEEDRALMDQAWELTTAHREDLIGRSEPPAPAVQDRPSVLDLLQRVPEAE